MTPSMLVVFDLDGTLVDSVDDLSTAVNALIVDLGGEKLPVERVGEMVGDGAALLVRRALSAAGLDPETPQALNRFLEHYEVHLLDRTRAYPGMREALVLASSRARLAVLTNKPVGPARRILAGLGLAELFDDVIGGDGPFPRKPDPTALQTLMSGWESRVCLMIGDTPVDAETAERAGCPFVLAAYGFGARRFGPKPAARYVLEQPVDLAELMDRFERTRAGA